jgi:hypothetical protein
MSTHEPIFVFVNESIFDDSLRFEKKKEENEDDSSSDASMEEPKPKKKKKAMKESKELVNLLTVDTSMAKSLIPIDNEDKFKSLETELGSNNDLANQLMGHVYKTMKEDKKIKKIEENNNLYSLLVEKSFFRKKCFRTQFTWKTDPNATKSKKEDSVENQESPIPTTVFLFESKLTSKVLRLFQKIILKHKLMLKLIVKILEFFLNLKYKNFQNPKSIKLPYFQ